jgi:F0F1-type ATP synthase membrane subunit c/vacuolar-type H+-ATPase subunit K
MKKLALLSLVAPAAFAAEEAAAVATATAGHGIDVLGIALAVALSALAIGLIGFGAASAIGRNPSAASDIKSATLLPMVFAEGLGIVAVVLAFVVAFVK